MLLRYKDTKQTFTSSKFNIHALAEVDAGDDSVFFKDLDVFIENKQEWIDFNTALQNHDIIPDNYNTYFREPKNEEERKRGYYL
jgi:hypothetical protein